MHYDLRNSFVLFRVGKIGSRDPCHAKHVRGKIDSPAIKVFAYVTQKIGQLQRDAETSGTSQRAWKITFGYGPINVGQENSQLRLRYRKYSYLRDR